MLEFLDGFDYYQTAQLTRRGYVLNGSPTIGNTSGEDGNGCIVRTQNAQTLRLSTLTTRTTYIFGFFNYLAKNNITSGNKVGILSAYSTDDTNMLNVYVNANGAINTDYYDGSGRSTLDSSAGLIANNTWQNIWIKYTVNGSTGILQVYIDGTAYINGTGLNTSNKNISYCYIGTPASTGWVIDSQPRCDHFWIFNQTGSHSNDIPAGKMVVQTIRPDSDNAISWAPNVGVTNYTQVNEAHVDDDTSYVFDSVAGDIDKYTYGNTSGTVAQVHGIQVVTTYRKDDVDAKTMEALIDSSGTILNGNVLTPTVAYAFDVWNPGDDPHISGAWTQTTVNAIKAGVKVLS